MSDRSAPRPGGRSARVQAAVHQAVRDLQAEHGRGNVTVPMIASQAGVTPSTIYRRWGDLTQLLADVAIDQLQPDLPPADTGSFRGDLEAWTVQYAEEMASGPGRALLRDALTAEGAERACRCDGFTRQQIDTMRERGQARGEPVLATDPIIDQVIAPLLYRILFVNHAPDADEVRALLAAVAAH